MHGRGADGTVTRLELLSPAGDAECGMAAIDHGADAVYIGAPRFSARADAGAALDDISRLVRHAHLYYGKVYVALNTILSDQELPEALEIIHEVFRRGADGLIIQDMGLLELDLPPIPLIGSTQMHNATPEKVQFLEAVGFKRAILARELTLDEIASIRASTHIELEAFVHGALCVSYSGQCYMSQAAAGRSGNRGVCAQPCRSPYTLTDGNGRVIRQEKFVLCLKDMNRIDFIPDLVRAGVTSFKIEGRYKGIDYVKNVTAAYRQAVDRFIEEHDGYGRSSSGASSFSFAPDLDKTFNRGYTPYFISGKKEKIGSMDTQKSTGEHVGVVTGTGKDYFRLSGGELHNGDGLCFFTRQGHLTGFRVNRADKEKIYPNTMKGLEIGTRLYRNHDAAFVRVLKKPSARRTISIRLALTQEDNAVRLAVADEDGNEAETRAEITVEPSRDPARMREQIARQLSSTGNTPYRVEGVTIHPPKPGFLPISTLNGMRRDVLDALTCVRMERCPRDTRQVIANAVPYPAKKLDFRGNVLNEQARHFYRRHGVESIDPAFETLSDMDGKRVMTCRYCIRYELDLCPKYGTGARSLEEPLRIRDSNTSYRLDFDCGRCRMLVTIEAAPHRRLP